MTALIVALLPELTDVNGDAQNALVLAQRARWAGEDARVERVAAGERPSGTPAVVVLGSTTDPSLPRLVTGLTALRDDLVGWVDDGVPLLAVGTGMEALGGPIGLPSGRLDGLGVLPGESRPLAARIAGDLVVGTPEGELVGYENHSRGFRLDAGAQPLGRVLLGVGDGHGFDGVRHGSVIGTRLHGPVLAKNPHLADAVLATVFSRPVVPQGAVAQAADAAAARLRAAVRPPAR